MKIIVANKVSLLSTDLEALQKIGTVEIYEDLPDVATAISRIKDADIIIATNLLAMPKEFIHAEPTLKMVCVAATGFDNIDLAAAKERNIVVCNVPTYSTEAVAEHTIGLMLAASRLTHKAQTELRNEIYTPFVYKGKELARKKLGILGHGNIGKRVEEIAKNGFGMTVSFTDSKTTREQFEQILRESDFICLNAPLTEKTRGMLSHSEFGLMKDGVVLVNTGRGGLIDEAAMIEALKSGKIFGAGLDVLCDEPMKCTNAFFSFPNVIITPHIGFNTEESAVAMSHIILGNVQGFLAGTPQNVVS